jgi:hypothetical protein
VLTAYTNNRGWIPVSRYYDIVDKARKRRDTTNEECDNGAPIGGKFGRIAVDTMKPVHVRYRHVASSDNEVAVVRYVSAYNHGKRGSVELEITNSVMSMDVMGPKKIV